MPKWISRYKQVLEIFLFIALGFILAFSHFEAFHNLLALLLVVGLTGLWLSDDTEAIKLVTVLLLAVAIFWLPLWFFLPLLAYLASFSKWRFYLYPLLLLSLFRGVFEFNSLDFFLIVLFSFLAVYLSYLLIEARGIKKDLLLQRDTAQELRIRIQEQREAWESMRLEASQRATFEERSRIAREMHDSVGHVLTRAILQVGAIRQINQDSRLEEPLSALVTTLDRGMEQTRASLHQLRDRSVDLYHEIKQLVRLSEGQGFEIHLNYDLSLEVPSQYRQILLLSCQEALTNIQKHAPEAKQVWIQLREFPAFYQFSVRNDGNRKLSAPVLEASVLKPGMGLENMRLRSEALRGRFHVKSDEEFGVFLTLPKKI